MLQLPKRTPCIKAYLILSLFLLSIKVAAQQLPNFNQYRDLQTVINPGAIPIDYFVYDYEPTVFLGAIWKEQWFNSGIEDHPSTQIFKADFLVPDIGAGSLLTGGYILNDRNGIFETTGAYGKIAAIIDLYAGELSVGLNLGFVQRRLKFRTGDAPVIEDTFSGTFPDAGVGIFYRQEFQGQSFFYTGISVPQVVALENTIVGATEPYSIKLKHHYYGTLGFLTYFLNSSFFEPTIWIKYVPNAPLSIDINLRTQLEDHFFLGAGFSTDSKTINLTAGVLQKWDTAILKIGFGYNPQPFTVYGADLKNSFEVMVNYYF